jgi:NAD(P)-dependent dehydrogenase (short-subunit alcohol dehydrogenase family)
VGNPMDLFSLDDKVALVTGAGSGLGRQFSEVMAEAGADVACADIDEESARGAVVNLTRELGLEYAKQGIQVNALCPGFYQTNLSRGAIDDPQVRATITAFIPMGRIAEAAEIKGPALFLASAASDYMTGQTLVADGGCLAK